MVIFIDPNFPCQACTDLQPWPFRWLTNGKKNRRLLCVALVALNVLRVQHQTCTGFTYGAEEVAQDTGSSMSVLVRHEGAKCWTSLRTKYTTLMSSSGSAGACQPRYQCCQYSSLVQYIAFNIVHPLLHRASQRFYKDAIEARMNLFIHVWRVAKVSVETVHRA